jgi:hypothetical protein
MGAGKRHIPAEGLTKPEEMRPDNRFAMIS